MANCIYKWRLQVQPLHFNLIFSFTVSAKSVPMTHAHALAHPPRAHTQAVTPRALILANAACHMRLRDALAASPLDAPQHAALEAQLADLYASIFDGPTPGKLVPVLVLTETHHLPQASRRMTASSTRSAAHRCCTPRCRGRCTPRRARRCSSRRRKPR